MISFYYRYFRFFIRQSHSVYSVRSSIKPVNMYDLYPYFVTINVSRGTNQPEVSHLAYLDRDLERNKVSELCRIRKWEI